MARQRYDIGSKWMLHHQGKGGERTMIESPVLQKMMAQRSHELIVEALKERFKSVPRDITKSLREVVEEKRLKQLMRVAISCSDLDGFRQALMSA